MSRDVSREASVEKTGEDIHNASTSKTAIDTHVDTSETDPKGSKQEEDDLGKHNHNHGDDNDDGKERREGESVESEKTDGANADPTQANAQAINNAASATAGDWQAIWSPQYNAYYFYNARTQETTWANPVQPQGKNGAGTSTDAGSSSTSSLYPSSTAALYAAAEAAGIDPSLAHLDPTLAMPGTTPTGAFTAKFNARTGTFTRVDGRDPSFLSEAERAKRMSTVYFDVNAWEAELEERYEEEAMNGKKRKRPTKQDLERFKEQKRLKKIAKTAWLRT